MLGLVNRLLPGIPADVAGAPGPGDARRSDPDLPVEGGGRTRWTRGRELRGTLPGPLEKALDRSGRPTNQ